MQEAEQRELHVQELQEHIAEKGREELELSGEITSLGEDRTRLLGQIRQLEHALAMTKETLLKVFCLLMRSLLFSHTWYVRPIRD